MPRLFVNAAALISAAILPAVTAGASGQGILAIHANGESLATQGFVAPESTRDGWELSFDHIFVTLGDITALQTDPPYQAAAGDVPVAETRVGFAAQPVTVDLARPDATGRVFVVSAPAPAGHYNAVTWSVVPAPDGEWAGRSMVLIGTATKDGEAQPFTLTSTARQTYTCGEYIGDRRKGILAPQGQADLELTFHLDHIFGRLDKGPDDPMNISAPGFAALVADGAGVMDLAGLHIGHVGEGHCAVSMD